MEGASAEESQLAPLLTVTRVLVTVSKPKKTLGFFKVLLTANWTSHS